MERYEKTKEERETRESKRFAEILSDRIRQLASGKLDQDSLSNGHFCEDQRVPTRSGEASLSSLEGSNYGDRRVAHWRGKTHRSRQVSQTEEFDESLTNTSGSRVPMRSGETSLSSLEGSRYRDRRVAHGRDMRDRSGRFSQTKEFDESLNSEVQKKNSLMRDEREWIRLTQVARKKDYVCLERINGKLVNIVKGLELHTCVFNATEQKTIVDYVYSLPEMGRKNELRGILWHLTGTVFLRLAEFDSDLGESLGPGRISCSYEIIGNWSSLSRPSKYYMDFAANLVSAWFKGLVHI
ncbi:hypothetical protein AMTR_s00027p00219810 [Amborella trichopoda]|uniref:Uncharacterized protein n=1 Tax=Amborella trichopoda TaxID=13333 RepID=W1PLB0_AMBTC|nr:hypothetical protein AMTR_s00027p00219810 [Amborella trichopoda]